MACPKLEALKADDFYIALGACSNPNSTCRWLKRQPDVLAFKEAFESGEISETEVRDFVDTLLKEYFKIGFHFPYDITLAAVAIGIADKDTPFTKEYIDDLLKLKRVTEVTWAARIVECMNECM